MKLHERGYMLPPEIVDRFERAVEPGQRSAVIAELMRRWLDERDHDKLRNDIVAGCEDMSDVYLEIEKEYRPLEEEALLMTDDG